MGSPGLVLTPRATHAAITTHSGLARTSQDKDLPAYLGYLPTAPASGRVVLAVPRIMWSRQGIVDRQTGPSQPRAERLVTARVLRSAANSHCACQGTWRGHQGVILKIAFRAPPELRRRSAYRLD